jgi:hypothetical protein
MRVLTQIIVAILLLVLFGVCSTFLLRRGGGSDDDRAEFVAEVNEAAIALFVDYIEPARSISIRTNGECPSVTLPSEHPTCAAWVSVLEELEPVLASSIDHLGELQQRGMSPQYVGASPSIDDLVELATLTHQSDALLIDGWNNSDNSKWEQGWELRRMITQFDTPPGFEETQ